jgi:hypothetical protein
VKGLGVPITQPNAKCQDDRYLPKNIRIRIVPNTIPEENSLKFQSKPQ